MDDKQSKAKRRKKKISKPKPQSSAKVCTVEPGKTTASNGFSWRKFFRDLKMVVMTIFKFIFSGVDIGTDLVNGINFITGEYGLAVYFIAGVRSDFPNEEYGPQYLFGVLTLSLVWMPGAFRTREMAVDTNWSDLSYWQRLMKGFCLVVIFAAWPLLTVFL